LLAGGLDQPQDQPAAEAATRPVAESIDDPAAIPPLATRRCRSAPEPIFDAARDGRLTDDDIELLAQIAQRIATRTDTYAKLRNAADADRPPK
jgi:hypothetical protein